MRPINADELKELYGGDGLYTAAHFRTAIDEMPTVNPWHKVEEPPNEDGWYMLGFLSRWKNGSWWIPNFPDYWMPIEPPKENV